MSLGCLTVLPALTASPGDGDAIVLTKKFVEGMAAYCRVWPGPVRVVFHPEQERTSDLDHVMARPGELPFESELCSYESPELEQRLRGSALVMGGPDYRIPNLVRWCHAAGAASVLVTEYSLQTRLSIGRLEGARSLRQFKHVLWELNQERLNLQAVRAADGVQCNGTPTFNLYRYVAKNPFLYFDTRTDAELFATEAEMQARRARLLRGDPLTLAFSGRLIAMKGADHLLDVAAALKRRGFPFRFLIAGDGASAEGMRQRIAREALHEVQMLGVLDFRSELMPLVRREVDVFVICHRQGDPSCTYLETLATGTPIAGYTNEAFAGLLDLAQIGWGAPLDEPERLADVLMGLSRAEIARRSEIGLRFAHEHSFDATFERRAQHLLQVARDFHGARRKISA